MGWMEKKAKEMYELQQAFGNELKAMRVELEEEKDTRYNEPKGKPTASEEQIDEAIENNEIYLRAKEHILNAQREQIAYGLGKYPETLNANTWSMIETIDHIIGESVDKLHYLTMFRIQLEDLAKPLEEETL